MATTTQDRFDGAVIAPIGKQPVDCATTAAIDLSGYQTIDGVVLDTDWLRVLVKNQSDSTLNGIYVVFSGLWARAKDFNGPSGTVYGQLVQVTGGSQQGLWQITTPNPIAVDGSNPSHLTFALFTASGGTVPKPGPAGTLLTSNGLSGEWDVLNVQAATFGFLWPAYIYPANIPDGTQGLDMFNAFIAYMATYNQVPVIAILSPDSGGADSNYVSMFAKMTAAGARVISYIFTEGATRDINVVKGTIDGLIEFYPLLQGFFVDEMNPDDTFISYYEELAAYIHGKNPNYFITGNGGVNLTEDFFTDPVFDLYCIYENSNGGYPTVQLASNNGIGPRSHKSTIVGNQTFDANGFAIQTTNSAYVWLTDAPADAAYESLPSYLETLFQILTGLTVAAQVNGVLQPVNGGFGLQSPFKNNLLMGNGTHPIQEIAPTLPGDIVLCDGVTFLSGPQISFGNFVPTGMLIPAYVYPSPTTYFDTLLAAGAANPNVPMIFALTPSFNDGGDVNYAAIIPTIQAAGHRVVVVVDVANATLAIATAKSRCATLQGYYPSIDGIIVVGMPNTSPNLSYQQQLYTYIKTTLGMNLVVGDPGTTTPSIYLDGSCADIVIVSSTDTSYPNAAQVSNAGVGTRSQLASLVNLATYDPVGYALMAKYCAWAYATDMAPTSGTPTALNDMFELLAQLDLPPSITIPAASIVANPKAVAGPATAVTGKANQVPRVDPTGAKIIFTSSGLPVVEVTGTTQQMVPNVCYVANNASLVTFTLPAAWVEGDEVAVMGKGAGGWKIAQNASQKIQFAANATTPGVTGHMDSAAQYNNVHLKAISTLILSTIAVIGSPTCT